MSAHTWRTDARFHGQARDHSLIAAAAFEDLLAKRRATIEDEMEEESEDEDEEDMEDDELAGARCIF